jgi:hypothetical protein
MVEKVARSAVDRFDFQHQNKNTEKVKDTKKENLK